VRRFVPFLIVTFAASPASADKQQCLTAHEDAQRLRTEGKLRAAREKLLICSAEACPSLVKVDCTKWLPEVDRDLPTLIVRAKDDAGLDVADANVELDGEKVAGGKAVAVDPGTHTVKVERAGKTIEQQVVIAAGEKNRLVELTFPSEVVKPAESISPLPYILAGVGVVGIAGFAGFGLSARGRLSELRDTCAPNCDPGEKRSIQTQLVLADVSLAIGVVSLGAAAYLFLKPSPSTTVALAPGYATWSVVF
jgi:hypothetical protein